MRCAALFLLAAVLTASATPGHDVSWNELIARAMTPEHESTVQALESGKCGDRCYLKIGEEIRLFDKGLGYVDERDPCNPYTCKNDGMTQSGIQDQCQNIFSCDDPTLLVVLPGECCSRCVGPSQETVGFSEWGEWTTCSRTCGGGARARRRECLTEGNGETVMCTGELVEIDPEACNTLRCPRRCLWEWGNFGACTKSCGVGTMSRYPIITQQAEAGGEPCPPDVIDKIAETRKCDERMCPVPCVWRAWSAWTACSVMCGEGIEMRTRKRFPAKYDGPNCVGPATEERECKLDPCSADKKVVTAEIMEKLMEMYNSN